MKKKLFIALTVVLAIGWGTRFYYVNQNLDLANIQVFAKGEKVPVGKNYHINADERLDGYSFTVLDAELVSEEDFLKKYHGEDKANELSPFVDYFYTVRVSIENKDNPFTNQAGINLRLFNLQGTDYILAVDPISFELANPNMPGMDFSLRKGTTMEMTLTFEVMSQLTSKKHLSKDKPKLVISYYPDKKMLELH